MNYRNSLITSFVIIIFWVGCQPLTTRQDGQPAANQWLRIGPGGGGSTFIPTFSFHSKDRFIIRCDMTGSYNTQDGGQSYQQVNFPNGASAYAFDPSDDETLYAGSQWLYKSSDGGQHWTKIFPKPAWVVSESFLGDHANYGLTVQDSISFPPGGIENILIDPFRSATISFTIDSIFYHSEDGGNSWSYFPVASPIEYIYTDKNQNNIILFTSQSYYRFDKHTLHMESVALPATMVPAFSFSGGVGKTNGETIFYALHRNTVTSLDTPGATAVWASSDGGRQWHILHDPVITNEQDVKPSYSRIACAAQDAEKVYLVTDQYIEREENGKSYHWYGTLKSSDAGENWDWVWKGGGGSGTYGVKDGKGVSNLTDAWVEEAFGGEYIRLIDVGVYPGDGNVAIVTDWYRAMKTTDGGKSWQEIYSKQQPDGTFASRGLDVTTSYGVHRDPFNPDHLAISYTDIGYHHSYNNGKSWKRSTEGVPTAWQNTCYWVLFDPAIKDKVWSVWSGMHDIPRGKMTRNPQWKENAKGGVCMSVNGGKTWQPERNGLEESPVTSLVLDPASPPDRRTLYASVYGKGVFKSTDDGKSWEPKNSGIGQNKCAFELTLAADGTLYLIVSPTPMHKDGKRGREYFSGAVYKSEDGAATWNKLTITDGPLFPNGLTVDPTHSQRIYLACWSDMMLSDLVGGDLTQSTGGNQPIDMPGGVFISEDAGATWKQTFDENAYVYDVTADPQHPGRLYINTFNQAAFGSEDDGKTWKKMEGYDFHWGHRVLVDEQEPDKVFITTFGSSVWHGTPQYGN